jgi:hypothetical protein
MCRPSSRPGYSVHVPAREQEAATEGLHEGREAPELTEKLDSSFSTSGVPHFGHSICSLVRKTIFSKAALHCLQRYSNIGIRTL